MKSKYETLLLETAQVTGAYNKSTVIAKIVKPHARKARYKGLDRKRSQGIGRH